MSKPTNETRKALAIAVLLGATLECVARENKNDKLRSYVK